MERSTALLLIAIALALYGLYHAIHAIAMLPGPSSVLVLVAFTVQAVLAIVAATGVWQQRRWAGAMLVLLGLAIAATALIEAFILGIIAWLYALVIAVAAILIGLLLGAYVNRSGTRSLAGDAQSGVARIGS